MEHVVTVFFQGHGASRHQAAKYAGAHGVRLPIDGGGSKLVWMPSAPEPLLHNLYAYPELEDMSYGWSWNPLHWVMKLVHFVVLYFWYGMRGIARTIPHQFVTLDSVGGPDDVRQYVAAVEAAARDHPGKKLVLFGCSRGAAVVLCALPRLSPALPVALAIVEAPFATVPSVMRARFGRAAPLLEWLLVHATRYRPSQYSPLDAVNDAAFPLTLPLAFVISAADRVVPRDESLLLHRVLCERGHTALHHCMLRESAHPEMPLTERAAYGAFLKDMYALIK